MYYFISEGDCPYYHQAMEEVLFQRQTEAEIYLLWINKPAIVFGSYQNPYREINFPFAWEKDIPIIRRITGGGTVYHDFGNINYSIIKKENPEKMDYVRVMAPIIRALNELGYPVDHRNSCDIYLGDKKISGNAQKMSKGRLLHHGTLLFDADLTELKQSTSKKQDQIQSKGIASRPAHVGNLKDYRQGPYGTTRDFMEALAMVWIPQQAEKLELTEEEKLEVDRLVREKYKDDTWTYGKAPEHAYQADFTWKNKAVKLSYQAKQGSILGGQIYLDEKLAEEASRALTGLRLNKEHLDKYCSTYFDSSILYEFI